MNQEQQKQQLVSNSLVEQSSSPSPPVRDDDVGDCIGIGNSIDDIDYLWQADRASPSAPQQEEPVAVTVSIVWIGCIFDLIE